MDGRPAMMDAWPPSMMDGWKKKGSAWVPDPGPRGHPSIILDGVSDRISDSISDRIPERILDRIWDIG